MATSGFGRAEPTPGELEFFEKKIRPLLVERCYKCHSSASEKLKGGLLLDSRAGVLKGGDNGAIVLPGSPEKSKLIEAIHYQNPDLQMPPKGKLSDQEIAALTEWVKMEVPWPREAPPKTAAAAPVFDLEQRRREHWAWQPIRVAEPPPTQNQRWASNAVDQFILAGLEAHQLQPAPAADPRTLLRRLSFDLTGMPPTAKELEELQNPAWNYEMTVDRLLASPHFGERWARHWLDLVRYAETLGYEFDYPLQNGWRYRDYVIRALNADVPYDRFVTEHIAGDAAPPRVSADGAFNESVIGTGFFWMGQREHSPVDARQHQAEVIDNQIDVMSKTFLGLTVACARCHDHKFDAISTADYYGLYGVLESSRYAQASIEPIALGTIQEFLALKREMQRAAVAEWSNALPQVAKYLFAAEVSRSGETNAVDAGLDPRRLALWRDALQENELMDASHPLYPWVVLARTKPDLSFEQRWQKLLDTQSQRERGARVPQSNEVFATATEHGFKGWFASGAAAFPGAVRIGDFIVGDSNSPMRILSEPAVDDSLASRKLEGCLRSPGFKIDRRYAYIFAAGSDVRVRICVDNLTTIRDPIYGGLMKDLQSEKPKWLSFDLGMWLGHRAYIEFSDMVTPDPADESKREGWSRRGYFSAQRVVFSDQAKPPGGIEPAAWPDLFDGVPPKSLDALAHKYQRALERILENWLASGRSDNRIQPGEAKLLNWLVEHKLLGEAAGLAFLMHKYHALEAALPQPVRVPAMEDGDGLDERVFIRGNHKTPGEPAPRRFLTALQPDESARFKNGSGRLELAQCMTSSRNPLLARVMVNRVWLHLFGRGIVATPDDFGALGQRPTHPDLLDWLANWYRTEGKWSTKRLIRLLVTSSAYRMSSAANDAGAEEKDPENTWFHRMPLKRLEGEAIRDAMLTVSGRLEDSMFGPPVPVHLTEFMEGRGRPSASGPLDGAGRRSIYLEVRRNFLSPMMRAFDTPIPFATIGRRTVSNVPAQSLILLNDPFVAGQASLWARRLLADGDASSEELIRRLYIAAFGRSPTAEERAKALAFLEKQGVAYNLALPQIRQDEKAWADLCHVAFNLKEFIFVE